MTDFIRNRLLDLIEDSGFSPSRLSEDLHLNKGYFADVRRGKQSVPYDILALICKLFQITLSEFFDPDYSLRGIHREVNLLCQKIPDDQLQNIIIPILERFAEKTK